MNVRTTSRVMIAPLKIRAAPSTLIVLSCLCLPFFLGFLWLYLFKRSDIGPVILIGAICIVLYIWWDRFLVEIASDTLSYRTLFSGTREIALKNIAKVVRNVDFKSRGMRPPIRLEIYSRDNLKKAAFDINLKVFSPRDLAVIDTALKPFLSVD